MSPPGFYPFPPKSYGAKCLKSLYEPFPHFVSTHSNKWYNKPAHANCYIITVTVVFFHTDNTLPLQQADDNVFYFR